MDETPTEQATEQIGTPQVQTAFDLLSAGWKKHGGLSYKQRMKLLKGLIRALRTHRDALVAAVAEDYGNRNAFETLIGEVFVVREMAKHARANLRDWMEPQDAEVSIYFKFARARVVSQPLGVIGVIAPWNYPIQLSLGPIIGAIAAGNRVLIKTSEFTPHSHKAIAAIIAEVFPPDVVQIITGAADVGSAVASLPVDHLLFTGSERVGRMVMRAAAENLTPVTLELGGKSPALVHDSFSLTKAAERIVWGKLFNSGQTCVAPDYVFVPKGKGQAFADAAKAAYERFYPSMKNNKEHTSLIHERQFQRLTGLVEEAREAGVTVIQAGAEAPDPESRKMPLTLLLAPGADLRVMQEEIFGPVLPVLEYDSIDDAIQHVNDRPRPLALYYFDRRNRRIRDVLARTTSGGAAINECLLHQAQPTIPFGGVGASGMGAYHGHHGFQTFSHQKSVLIQKRLNLLSLLNPPSSALARLFARIVTFL
jgi:coniferyl-aldehyde dehydrogenase